MAKSSAIEVDFFNLEKKESRPSPPPIFQRRRSFRDIQGVITKLNPEVVKSVITGKPFVSVPDPKFCDEKSGNRAPMTIFYNGMVSVYDVSPLKAHDILTVAEEVTPKPTQNSETNILESLNGDLPISRKNSLQRFLEKRKERLITVSPYHYWASEPENK